MKRFTLTLALVSVLNAAGIAFAHEGEEGRPRRSVPPQVQEIEKKYEEREAQLRAEFQQKMQAMRQEKLREMQALREAYRQRKEEAPEGASVRRQHPERMRQPDPRFREHKRMGESDS